MAREAGGECTTVVLLNAKLPFKYYVYTHRLVMLSTLVRGDCFYGEAGVAVNGEAHN